MKLWVPREVTIRLGHDAPGHTTLRHRHNYVQAGMILSGAYHIELDNQHYMTAGPGEFFSIAQHQEHVIAASRRSNVEVIDLRFKAYLTDVAESAFELAGCRLLGVIPDQSFKIAKRHTRRLWQILNIMLAQARVTDDASAFVLCLRMMELAAMIRQAPRRVCKRMNIYASREHQSVVKTLDLIRKRYAEPLSLTDLSAATGVSTSHLSRLFRQFTGASPKQYLLTCRIEAAKRLLLLHDNALMKEIAFQTGFPDQRQFSRAFRRATGCAPTDFLK